MSSGRAPNIVLLCLDSVRNDFFREAAPRIVDAADVSFDQCRAASSWSGPSQASIVTGVLPHVHGVHTYSRSYESVPKADTIMGTLEDYHTVGISANAYAGPAFGFDRYFDEFYSLVRQTRFPEAATAEEFLADYDGDDAYLDYLRHCLRDDHPVKSFCNGVIELASKAAPVDLWRPFFDEGASPGLRMARKVLGDADRPTFVFMNLMEGHVPYRPATYLDRDLYDCPPTWSSTTKSSWELRLGEYDEEYWHRRNQLYRAHIDYLDRKISAFAEDVGDDTTVVVTADHGDDLGTPVDEGFVNHKSSLTEGVLHVPLHVLNAPDEVETQRSRYVSHLQVPALLRSIAEERLEDVTRESVPAEVLGMGGGSPPPEGVDDRFWDRTIRCAYRDDEKVVWDTTGAVARYEVSPERSNWQRKVEALDEPPEWATAHFEADIQTVRRRAKAAEEELDVDAKTEKRLQELGYL